MEPKTTAAEENALSPAAYRDRVLDNCGIIIKGKRDVIENVLIAFLCGGHVLLEDVPGTGKTMLLRAFAKTTGGDFRRIQFTPDLLPSDLTGIHFYNQKTGEFEFRPGPLFSNMILADEINRATPRTQSALLEAMAEGQVTVDGKSFPMASPFMIMATQNPIESYGTFPLPEAQKDRFFMRLSLGYMQREEEMRVMYGEDTASLLSSLRQVVTPEETAAVRQAVQAVTVPEEVGTYLMQIIEETRKDSRIRIGASTRGTLALYAAARTKACLSGRTYVIPEDVKELAPFILAHRLSCAGTLRSGEDTALLADILGVIPVPTEDIGT